MSNAIIRAAFETTLATWAAAQSPAIAIGHENESFPAPVGRYVLAYLLPLPTQSDTLDRKHRSFEGVFQVNIFTPEGGGPAEAEALAGSLDTAFGSLLNGGGLVIHLTRPMSAGQAVPDADRFMVPVDCSYRAERA